MSQVSRQKPTVSAPQPLPLQFVHHPRAWLYALWKFARPHTIVGTTLSVMALYLLVGALPDRWLPPASGVALVTTWLACLGGNVYIVGLNQLEDIDIDRINKPHLPLASGEFTIPQGRRMVAIALLLALVLSVLEGPYLLGMVLVSLLLGTAYSLPPLRLKRFPFWASFCIFTVRGVVVNLGLFLHFNHHAQHFSTVPPVIWALTLFILVFTFAIAIFKDIPDLEGDRFYHINTLTVRLGRKAVFDLSRWIISFCYGFMILASLVLPNINRPLLGISQLVLLVIFWLRSFRVDLNDRAAIAKFYQFIWVLFFLEYILLPIACIG